MERSSAQCTRCWSALFGRGAGDGSARARPHEGAAPAAASMRRPSVDSSSFVCRSCHWRRHHHQQQPPSRCRHVESGRASRASPTAVRLRVDTRPEMSGVRSVDQQRQQQQATSTTDAVLAAERRCVGESMDDACSGVAAVETMLVASSSRNRMRLHSRCRPSTSRLGRRIDLIQLEKAVSVSARRLRVQVRHADGPATQLAGWHSDDHAGAAKVLRTDKPNSASPIGPPIGLSPTAGAHLSTLPPELAFSSSLPPRLSTRPTCDRSTCLLAT